MREQQAVPRPAIRAGLFYPAHPEACRYEAQRLLAEGDPWAGHPEKTPRYVYGGLVPHAGWSYSGLLTAQTLRALLEVEAPPETVVLFGADHTGDASCGEVYSAGDWETPLGPVAVDESLAEAIVAGGEALRANPTAHAREHSLEVQLPLLRALAPEVKIVPIAVPADPLAVEIGAVVGRVITQRPAGSVVVVGSTDLSHHGGHFGCYGGVGPASEAYARKNDTQLLDVIATMNPRDVLREAITNRSACGSGAIAATLAACLALGATAAQLLEYTNSYTLTHQSDPQDPDDTCVGYASVLFC